MNLKASLGEVVKNHLNVFNNIPRKEMILLAVENKEAIISESGALASWTPTESTGRSPKDTVMVKRPESENSIDWTSRNNIAITEETFNMIFEGALEMLKTKDQVHVTDRVIGADSNYALPVKVVTDKALHSLFTYNMFLPIPPRHHSKYFF